MSRFAMRPSTRVCSCLAMAAAVAAIALQVAAVAEASPLIDLPSFRKQLATVEGAQAPNLFRRSMMRKRSDTGKATPSSSNDKGFVKIVDAPPKLLEARRNGNTLMECSASGSPAPVITWYKDGRPVNKQFSVQNEPSLGSESLGETKSRLELNCLQKEDAGFYQCVAESAGKKMTIATEVHVVGYHSAGCANEYLMGNGLGSTPSISQWMTTYMQPIGNDALLVCRAQNPEEAVIDWYGPDGEAIDETDGKYKVLPSGDLVIHGITFNDMGMFKCLASNENGEDMKETFVYPHAG